MVVVGEHFREVIVESVCRTVVCTECILILSGRLALDCGIVADIVCCKSVVTVVLLRIVIQTTLYLEVEVLDDMPGDRSVDGPVLADSSVVVISH